MIKIAETILKRREVNILFVITIAIVLGYFVKGIKINSDILSYLPNDDPVFKLFNYFGETYGGNQLALIAIETDDVFNKETIERINNLTQEFKKNENVTYVTSLTNFLDIITDDEGTLQINKLIDEYDLTYDFENIESNYCYVFEPELNYYPVENTERMFNMHIIDGKDTTMFGKIKDADELCLKFNYSF